MVYIVTKVIQGSDTRMVTYKISSDGKEDKKAMYSILDLLKIADKNIDSRFLDLQQEPEEDYESVDEDGEVVGARSIRDQLEVDQLLERTDQVAPVRETRKPAPIDGENTYVIESILKRRKFGKKWKYLVKYEGYPISDATWEFLRDIDAPDLIKKFMETIKIMKKK